MTQRKIDHGQMSKGNIESEEPSEESSNISVERYTLQDAKNLLRSPGRFGWRGHTTDWMKRAAAVIYGSHDPGVLSALSSVVCDPHLLRPSLACACPHGTRDAKTNQLWRDVQHAVIQRSGGIDGDAFVGCVAYYVRRRPRLGPSVVQQLRRSCRPGSLRRALEDSTWQPSGVAFDQERTRSRSILLLVAIDPSADRDTLQRAHQWLSNRPVEHATERLVEYAQAVFDDLENTAPSHEKAECDDGNAASRLVVDPFFSSESLRFFDT